MNSQIIRFIRESYSMTQRDFAKLVNCSYSLIALVELGKRNVTKSLENKISEALDLDQKQIESISLIVKEMGNGLPPFM